MQIGNDRDGQPPSARPARRCRCVARDDEFDGCFGPCVNARRGNHQTARAGEGETAAQAELKLAEARYAQGLGSQIELADAQTAVTTASGNLITAEWNLAAAWATLRRALGQQTAP